MRTIVMLPRILTVLTLCFVAFAGCTNGPSTAGAGTSTSEVGQRIKGQIDTFVEEAKKSPARAKGSLGLMLESLEGNAERGAAFAKVRDEAKKLQELYTSNAGKDEISAQLEALQASANALASEGG